MVAGCIAFVLGNYLEKNKFFVSSFAWEPVKDRNEKKQSTDWNCQQQFANLPAHFILTVKLQ